MEDTNPAHVSSTDILLNRNHDSTAFADPGQSNADGATLGHPTKQIFVTVDVVGFGVDAPSAWRHEIGHALGLGHGGDYNGANSTPPSTQFSAFDDHQYTTMSYVSWADADARYANQNPNPGTDWGLNPEGDTRTYSDSIQMLDILAIQQLYGVSTKTPFNGGQTYGFHSNIAGPLHDTYDFAINTQPVVTLFNKGTGNTLDVSGYSVDQRIDLRDGKFSDVGGLENNIAIAIGTRIDTAIGGSGADRMQGNDFANSLFGGNGADTIDGGAGSDRVDGGAGDDHVVYDANDLFTLGGSGNDTLMLNAGATVNLGSFLSQVPDKIVFGFENVDASGSASAVTLTSSFFGSSLIGGSAGDRLTGGFGKDTLDGGGGADILTGNAGADTFVFLPGFGKDTITDFLGGTNGGHDFIRFDQRVFADFADVLSHAAQVGSNVLITENATDILTLQNVKLGFLMTQDFQFG